MMSTSWTVNTTQPPDACRASGTDAPSPEPQAGPATRGFPEDQTERLISWIESGAITLMLTSLFLTTYG